MLGLMLGLVIWFAFCFCDCGWLLVVLFGCVVDGWFGDLVRCLYSCVMWFLVVGACSCSVVFGVELRCFGCLLAVIL